MIGVLYIAALQQCYEVLSGCNAPASFLDHNALIGSKRSLTGRNRLVALQIE